MQLRKKIEGNVKLKIEEKGYLLERGRLDLVLRVYCCTL